MYHRRGLAPPGGKSSIDISDGSEAPRVVRQPPGGRSSFDIGGGADAVAQTPAKPVEDDKVDANVGENEAKEVDTSVEEAGAEVADGENETKTEENGSENGTEEDKDEKTEEEKVDEVKEAKENGDKTVEVDTKVEVKAQEPEAAVPTPLRKRIPPGGYSTKLW